MVSLFITFFAAIIVNWKMVSKNPYNSRTHSNIGIRLAGEGRTLMAAKYFIKSIKLDPSKVESYNGLGNAMLDIGNVDEAISNFEKALKINPNFKEGRNNLNKAIELSVRKAKDALYIDPNNYEAQNKLGIALARQGNLKEAIDHFQEALRLKPDYSAAKNNLNKALSLDSHK